MSGGYTVELVSCCALGSTPCESVVYKNKTSMEISMGQMKLVIMAGHNFGCNMWGIN